MLLLAPSQVEVVWVKQSGLLLDSMLDPDSAEQQVCVCGVCVCVCVSCIESGRGWSVARVIDSTGK